LIELWSVHRVAQNHRQGATHTQTHSRQTGKQANSHGKQFVANFGRGNFSTLAWEYLWMPHNRRRGAQSKTLRFRHLSQKKSKTQTCDAQK